MQDWMEQGVCSLHGAAVRSHTEGAASEVNEVRRWWGVVAG